jgi:hypothetical protein
LGTEDRDGLIWDYCHLTHPMEPGVSLNSRVTPGQRLGMLGSTGAPFPHLHLGTYLSRRDCAIPPQTKEVITRQFDLYPWLVAAYQAQRPTGLLAVARPYHFVLVGEKVVFDSSNSMVWGGSKIVKWRWNLPDGRTVKQAQAEMTFDKVGTYVATLWVKDNRGVEDVDFCQVKVYSTPDPKATTPHILMTYTPTCDIPPGRPVLFRFWLQGPLPPLPKGEAGSLFRVDFGDGTAPADWQSGVELQHGFKKAGLYIVTATCQVAGNPVMQKQKVIVESVRGGR